MSKKVMRKSPEVTEQIRTGAAYIRVSTDDQLEYSPESQLEEIKRYCLQHNILLPSEFIFVEEEGRSGRKSSNRYAFQNMIAMAKTKPKPFDVIVLWKFSRFARNQDESTFYKSMLRKKLGIDVVSVSEPLIDGMYGRLIEMIIEWQDEFYSVNLSGEVRRSMLSRARKGLYNGKMPLGYTKPPNENPVIEEQEAAIVRKIFDMYASGSDINYITRGLNDHGYKTKPGKKFDQEGVIYILENPFYIGKVRYNMRESSATSTLRDPDEWIIADSFHEPIIDMETWNIVQERRERSKKLAGRYEHPVSHAKHWLSGLVKCPVCGKSLSHKEGYPRKSTNGTTYLSGEGFQCLGYMKGLHSGSQFISAKKLTDSVITSLRDVLESTTDVSFELVRTYEPTIELDCQRYQRELASLDRKLERIREAYMNEIDTLEDYKRNKEMIEKRRADLEALLADMTTAASGPENYKEQFLNRVQSVLDIIESDAPNDLKAEALRGIVRKIVFYKDTNTLEFHYYLMVE